jgi:hypothetical protein
LQQEIFTLNARENLMLEVLQGYFGLDQMSVFREINGVFSTLLRILRSKQVEYKSLKNALVPSPDRNEAAFVFDSRAIESGWYGFAVFERLLPALDRRGIHSILCGDYIGKNDAQERLYVEFRDNVELARDCTYRTSNQFFLVYINNLSDQMVEGLRNSLAPYPAYGFADCNWPSAFKTHLSMTLCNGFVKHGNLILAGHEDDRDNSEDIDVTGYPFEQNGYVCKSLQSMLFDLFLSYKIEREVRRGFESDTLFALNAISRTVVPLGDCGVQIEENKLNHLLKKKQGSMKRAGLVGLTKYELELMIRERIEASYIFNLTYIEKYDLMKFNTVLNLATEDTRHLVKLTASIEYKPRAKQLRLITMF